MGQKFTLILVALFFMNQLGAQSAREVGVEIKANLNSSKQIELKWLQQSGSTRYQVFTKNNTNTGWDRLADLSGSDTSFTDTTYKIGSRKEYRVARTSSNYTGFDGNGYIVAGFEVPAAESLGRVLLLIEDKYQTSASPEIKKYIRQIQNEGYTVDTHYVSSGEKPSNVKNWIYKQWQKDTTLATSIFLLGRVPVPYSGNMRPDGHTEHTGAWPADMYYGCFYVSWTDNSVNNSAATYSRNHNIPNDGKFDISRLNSTAKTSVDYCQLPVGRVDLTDMPSFGDDTTLIKRYLNKALLFRTGLRKVQNRGLIDDNFGYFSSEAFASGGYRNMATFSSQEPSTQDYLTEMKSNDYLLSYACGPGTYNSAGGIGSTSNFANDSLLNPFTMMFGSYFGDWDNSDNFLRAPLASKGWGLSNVWSGRPYWMFHSCAQGYPLSDAVLRTYNTWNIYNAAAWMSGVHTALMGDPTLRMFVVDNVHSLRLSSTCNEELKVHWGDVKDLADSVSVEEWSGNNLVNKWMTSSSDTQMVISKKPGNYHFSVRLLKKMSSASGTWWQWGARNFDSVEVSRKLKAEIISKLPSILCLKEIYAFNDTFDLQTGESRIWHLGMDSISIGSSVELKSDTAFATLLWLTLKNNLGCKYQDSVFVSFKNTSAANLNLSEKVACQYDSISISYPFGLNSGTFIWTIQDQQGASDTITGVSNIKINGKNAGNFTIKFSGLDTAGCNDELTDVITFNPTPGLPNFDLYEGLGRTRDTMRLKASSGWTNYWWNNVKTTDSLYWFVADTEGIVEVSLKISNEFGCESETAYRKYPIVLNQTSGLQMSLLEIYPNPANEKIRLISTTGSLKVFSSTGKLIWSNPLSEKSVELNIRDWTAGVYIFQMTDISGNIQNVKLIKH